MIVKCGNCQKNIYIENWRLKKHQIHYCSKACMAKGYLKQKMKRKCVICGNEFAFLESRLKHSNRIYCSAHCYQISRKKGKCFKCLVCGNEFYRSVSQIKNGGGKYCSALCAKKRAGKLHPAYKTGYFIFKTYSKTLENKKCLFCSSVKNVDLHHKDGNKMHNDPENWVPLCRSCHMRVHRMTQKFNVSFERAFKIFDIDKLHELSNYQYRTYAPSDVLLSV